MNAASYLAHFFVFLVATVVLLSSQSLTAILVDSFRKYWVGSSLQHHGAIPILGVDSESQLLSKWFTGIGLLARFLDSAITMNVPS